MKIFKIAYEQNGGEYEGLIQIECEILSMPSKFENIVIADDVKIRIDGKILKIYV